MRQATLKLKSYAGAIHIVDQSDFNKKAFQAILISFGMMAFFYVIILGNVIFNIIERKGYESEARGLSGEVLELELSYLELSEKVNGDLARQMGFTEARQSFTAERAGASLGSLSDSSNGF